MSKTPRFIVVIAASVMAVSAVQATPVTGTNITISDGNFGGSGWYSDREDNETELNPQTITEQVWDLEGMYLDNTKLTLVGGFNFAGYNHANHTYRSGDIFIDVDGDAVYGKANASSGSTQGYTGVGNTRGPAAPAQALNTFGYDYVIHFNSGMTGYDVFSLTNTSLVSRVTDVPSSNPWRYVSGGNALSGYQNVAIDPISSFTQNSGDFLGYNGNNTHYYLTVDISFLPDPTGVLFHYTMECGNDNLMGYVPDATSTLLMIGGALAALVGMGRKIGR